jgi:uncharacterized membrane protein YkvA (DUF1232 family)
VAENRLRRWARRALLELKVWRLVAAHPRTPRLCRWLVGVALAYALSPVDLVPDFIPGLGHLDDLLVVPLLLTLAARLVPGEVWTACRREAERVAEQASAAHEKGEA